VTTPRNPRRTRSDEPEERAVKPQPERYLVGRRRVLPQGVMPADLSTLEQALESMDGVNVLERLGVKGETTFVVATDVGGAQQLRDQLGEAVIVEPDAPLSLLASPARAPIEAMASDLGLVPLGDAVAVRVSVRGRTNHAPIAGAAVYLVGSLLPIQGVTDGNGDVTLTLLGEAPDALRGLYVKPRDDYWSLWIANPALDSARVNSVTLRRLDEGPDVDGFPQRDAYGWGQRAMSLDQIQAAHRGQGIKVAVVDSGINQAHADLEAAGGFDFTTNSDRTWEEDVVGHGTHVAGVIAALEDGGGVRGFAPEAEVYALKIFPGGKTSDLLKSLDWCIAQAIDVVNLSLGSGQRSELLEDKIQEAKESGVACVAAAGNSAGPVQYPAAFEDVLAVAAIGRIDPPSSPEDSYHRLQLGPLASLDGRYCVARFSCFGREVDVCAPGVAVLSAVTSGGYAAWDGTSMACPHVAGLAALVLAHNREVAAMPRGPRRVEALFDRIKRSATNLGINEVYQGAGLPDATRAIGEAPLANDPWGKLDDLLAEALAVLRAHV
jgi:subtilisin